MTTVDSSVSEPSMEWPESSPVDLLGPNCYVPPSSPVLAKVEFGGPSAAPVDVGPSSAPGPSDLPTPLSPLAQAKTEHLGRPLASKHRHEMTSTYSACPCSNHVSIAAGGKKPVVTSHGTVNVPAKTGADDEAPSPRFFSARERFYAELASMSSHRQPLLRGANATASGFTICCNNCDVAIPDAHWHCSSCDNGDFDLCTDCVDKGVLCDSRDHWLIKRFVQDGKVINSITERIEPKKAPTTEKVLVGRESPRAPAPPTSTAQVSQQPLSEGRTCNSCVTGKTMNSPPLSSVVLSP